ncbi:hypothetical protein A2318_01030 [Candidatus Uhrbacteria bacterium RIFOXYB2_FULL_45_11]|uniref:Clp R domain-containing protein n=1 Tax=Candidatus Uhrbacteria bacterium RIFOXYB2_FULL_45_11 TaxID=1802421 RepID=A0A1F7W990_9BACT|nr:MAG: hypothetical protein A2318_01030 [Candidatus Uhrbacteria bacterium RIFOXYB2_FULL_45_11]
MPNGYLLNKKFYLAQNLDHRAMEERAAKMHAAQTISGISFLVSALFLLAGTGLFVYQNGFTEIPALASFLRPSFALMLFSVGMVVGCFSFMHQSEIKRHLVYLPKRDRNSIDPELVSLDVVPKDAIDLIQFFHPSAMKALDSAFVLAERFGHTSIEPLHLFVGAIEDESATILFGRLGLSFEKIKDPLSRRLSTRQIGDLTGLNEEAEQVLLLAFRNAYVEGREHVSALELFFEAYKAESFLEDLFQEQNVDAEQFENMVDWIRIHEKIRDQYLQFQKAAASKPTGAMNRSMTSVATPLLDAFSEDLTTDAVYGRLPMMIGREEEIEQVFRVIEGGRESALLVGQHGVGKGSVLAGIAALMVEERVPDVLKDKRLVKISIPQLVSGVPVETAQERLMLMLDEVSRSRNIILALMDLEQLTADLAPLLSDYLSRGATFVIATTTPQDYTESIERSMLGRIFQKVRVDEPDEKTAIRILESKIGGIEHEKKVIFQYDAVEKCVKLSDRYMHEQYLPKKAIEIAREVAQQVAKNRGENGVVTGEDVAKIIATKTGIPVTNVAEDEKMKLLHLEDEMHGRIIGQDEAVKAVASALRRARADLRPGSRPIASFLFLGSTGVGKTELAKTLAATYFGSEQMMIRVDMSEYQDVRSMDKLIGAPGSNQGGLFSEAVRTRPFAVVLLDELEKADPNILNVFLQILDDGRVTDAAGRVIDFTNTIIIATSNAGTQYIQDAVARGESTDTIKTHLLEEELRTIYRPEFLNRFDGVIVFKPLEESQIVEITKLMIAQVTKRLEGKGIGFQVTDAEVLELAHKGYDPKFGARPLRRVVQEEVDNAIANALLEGKVQRRDTIVLDVGGVMSIQKGKEL